MNQPTNGNLGHLWYGNSTPGKSESHPSTIEGHLYGAESGKKIPGNYWWLPTGKKS